MENKKQVEFFKRKILSKIDQLKKITSGFNMFIELELLVKILKED